MNYDYIEELIRLAKKSDDKEVIIKILDEFKPYIYTLIKNTKVNGFNNDDLFQELNIKIIECIHKYNSNNTFVGYCTMALKNCIYNLYNSNKKYCSLELFENIDKNYKNDNYEVENILFCNKSLNDIEKRILIMYYIDRHTFKDISQLLGIPYSKIMGLKKVALKKLKNEIIS